MEGNDDVPVLRADALDEEDLTDPVQDEVHVDDPEQKILVLEVIRALADRQPDAQRLEEAKARHKAEDHGPSDRQHHMTGIPHTHEP